MISVDIVMEQDVDSSWCKRGMYVVSDVNEGLAIEFRDGAICFYPYLGEKEYNDFLNSASPGKWVWANAYRESYMLVDVGDNAEHLRSRIWDVFKNLPKTHVGPKKINKKKSS